MLVPSQHTLVQIIHVCNITLKKEKTAGEIQILGVFPNVELSSFFSRGFELLILVGTIWEMINEATSISPLGWGGGDQTRYCTVVLLISLLSGYYFWLFDLWFLICDNQG